MSLLPLVPPWPASELADVLSAVAWLLTQVDGSGNLLGCSLPPPAVLCGERYLKQHGPPNRVLFIPNPTTSEEAGPGEGRKINTKSLFALSETCDVYVWGPEVADDFLRFKAATDLRRAVFNAFHRVASGRTRLLGVDRLHRTNVTTNGEEFVLHLAYVSEIKQTPISVIPAPGAPTSPPDPQTPPNVTLPSGISIPTTVTPENP
jgi:hypothetical protein